MASRSHSEVSEKINLHFKNISYSCKRHFYSKERHQILKNINGYFNSSEMSAILGPSGCGKTTLLNILTGYISKGVSGDIYKNNEIIHSELLNKNCSFIMQDDNIHSSLTTKEAMTIVANLKFPKHVGSENKQKKVAEILKSLDIYECQETLVGKLSGGQKRRLSIALELIQNSQVLFFDEPTSGLDSSVSKQILLVLRKLSREGRTIICTIHHPSITLLELFDHLYVMTEGRCVYQGSVNRLLPYLESCETPLTCPSYHNPADFLLEVCRGEHGDVVEELVQKCKNGLISEYGIQMDFSHNESGSEFFKYEKIKSNEICKTNGETLSSVDQLKHNEFISTPQNIKIKKPIRASTLTSESVINKEIENQFLMEQENFENMHNDKLPKFNDSQACTEETRFIKLYDCSKIYSRIYNSYRKKRDKSLAYSENTAYNTTFSHQMLVLLHRSYILLKRNPDLIYMRLSLHIFMSVLMGYLFFGMGADAKHTINNYYFIFFSLLFNLYVAFSAMVVAFADDLPIVTREHFNKWYSVKSYYIATTIIDLPVQIFTSSLFILISYYLTSQKSELFRFCLLLFFCSLVSLVAQSIGMLCSATLKLQNAIIFGSVIVSLYIAFSGFCIPMKHTFVFLHWLFDVSFLRYGLEGSMHAIYGYNRQKLSCSTDYCHFQDAKKILEEIGMTEPRVIIDIGALLLYYIVIKFLTYIALWHRIARKR